MALLGTSEPCKGYTASWSATGTECCAAGAGRATSHGMYSNRSKRGSHLCGQSCFFLIRSCRLSLCCEPSFEERSAGNLHATICGSRGWVTTTGDPVGGAVRRPPIPIVDPKRTSPVRGSLRCSKPMRRALRTGSVTSQLLTCLHPCWSHVHRERRTSQRW